MHGPSGCRRSPGTEVDLLGSRGRAQRPRWGWSLVPGGRRALPPARMCPVLMRVDAEPGPCRDPSALDDRYPESRGSGQETPSSMLRPTPLSRWGTRRVPGSSYLEMGGLGHNRPAESLGQCLGAGAWNPSLLKAAPKHRHQGFLCLGQPKTNASDVACEPHLF